MNDSLDLDETVGAAQREAMAQLRADYSGLVVFAGNPEEGHPGHRALVAEAVPGRLPVSATDPAWGKLLDSDSAVTRLDADLDGAHPLLDKNDWRECLAAPLRDGQGLMGALVVADRGGVHRKFSRDDEDRMGALVDQLAVSLRKAMLHISIEHAATHDALTGLPNRVHFERLVDAALGEPGPVAVFLLDLDRFKEINDGLGHDVGDLLLRQFAERITEVLGPQATLSRLAGDEFAVLAPGVSHAEAIDLGNAVLDAAREPFHLRELSVAVSCSIGLARRTGPRQGRDLPPAPGRPGDVRRQGP